MSIDHATLCTFQSIKESLVAIAEVATKTAAAEDPATSHLERIATALSSIAESEAAVAEASLKRCAAVAEIDAANHRVALLHEQILTRDLAAAPVPISAAVEAMLRVAELQAAHLTATHQPGLQVGRFGDHVVKLPIYEFGPDSDAPWQQWDPLRASWRSWSVRGNGWVGWEASEGAGNEPADTIICRAVPRGEADASPMSRGPFPATKAEG